MTLAKRLAGHRSKSGLSMSQVARKSMMAKDHRGRITQGYISRLESGKETNPSLAKLQTLCKVYRVTLKELVG